MFSRFITDLKAEREFLPLSSVAASHGADIVPRFDFRNYYRGINTAQQIRYDKHSYRRIKLIGYDEIISADLKRGGIFLKLSSGRETIITVSPGESGEMLMAAIKGRNA